MTSTAILIDMVFDDSEQSEIGSHDDDGHDPGHHGDGGGEYGAAEAGTEGEEEGDEGEAAGDGVEDHDAREGFGGVF